MTARGRVRGRGASRGVGRAVAAVVAAVAMAGALLGYGAAPVAASGSDDEGGDGSGGGVGSFSDDDGSVHEAALEALAGEGVLAGTECGDALVCPDDPIKRWEMAVWLVRGLDGADPEASDTSYFDDVDADKWWAPHINRLFELGTATGCESSPAQYCPDDNVNRAQMATLMVRALGLDPARPVGFSDIALSSHADDIDALAATGIATGCGTDPLSYCPTDDVTRAGMATVLARALGLIDLPASVQFRAVDAGGQHTCALRTDNTVTCWGFNDAGQTDAPDGQFSALSAGGRHSCGLRTDDTVACWGLNDAEQTDAPDGQFSAVAAGGDPYGYEPGHSCGLRPDAKIVCWGNNNHGQAETPDGQFSAVTAGDLYSCGLRTDNTVTCWGSNDLRQTDAPDGQFSAVTAGGDHSCGLRTSGTVTCWGDNSDGGADSPGGRFSAVTAGGDHSCGLRTSGTATCWGDNSDGKADTPAGQFRAITAGGDHSCGLRTDSTIACWGTNVAEPTDAPRGQFSAVTAGGDHSCALRTDSTVTCWGNSAFGEAHASPGQFNAVSAGGDHSCALRTDSTVTCWGDSVFGEAHASPGQFSAVTAGSNHSCAVRANKTVTCWGNNRSEESDAPRGEFTAVSAGHGQTCGLRTSGAIACWGNNTQGQGDAPDGQFSAVTAGERHSCGLRTSGTIACWGNNTQGQGDAPDGQFSAVTAGERHSCGLRTSGTIACWGNNTQGQGDAPDGEFSAVTAGEEHSCGLRTNGTIACWSYTATVSPPAGVRRVIGPSQPNPAACRPFGVHGPTAGFPLSGPPATGTVKVAVLFVDFPNARAFHSTEDESWKSLVHARKYLEAASYRKLDLEFVPLHRWLRAEHNHDHYLGSTPIGTAITRAIDKEAVRLADPDFDFTGIDIVMIVMPSSHFGGANALGGVSTDEGRKSTLRINTDFYGRPWGLGRPYQWGPVATHELAHNLGLLDMYPYNFNRHDPPVVGERARPWQRTEFGLMALAAYFPFPSGHSFHAREMLAWSRWQLGWLDAEQIRCVIDPEATVSLSPVTDPGDGVAMAAIPRSARQMIVIESRRKTGYDTRAALKNEGVLVYTVDAGIEGGDLPIRAGDDIGDGLLDQYPVLAPGQSITVGGYTITVQSDDGATHTVTITENDPG